MIDPDSDRPVTKQLADLIRDQIRTGVLRPGDQILPIDRLAQEYAVGRDTARRALQILRSEGLVVTRSPHGTFVADRPQQRMERVPRGSTASARMPSPEERRRFGIAEGVPLLEVTSPGGRVELLPADRVLLWFEE